MNKNAIIADLYNKYNKAVQKVCLRYVGNVQIAQDLAQDVFIRIFKNIEQFKGESAQFTWIYRIAVNISLDYLRTEQRHKKKWEGVQDSLQSQYMDAQGALLSDKLLELLLGQSQGEEKEIVVMHFLEGKTHREISRDMGVSRVAITRRLARFAKSSKTQINQYMSNLEVAEDSFMPMVA